MDITLETPDDIEHFLRMPALAVIPPRQLLITEEKRTSRITAGGCTGRRKRRKFRGIQEGFGKRLGSPSRVGEDDNFAAIWRSWS